MNHVRILSIALLLLTLCMTASNVIAADSAPGGQRVFELRKYYAAPGKLEALHARFRDHTNTIFARHGMQIIGYWVPTNGPDANKALIYILAFPSADAQKKSWADFQKDPEWVKVKADSEKDGKLVDKVESTLMTPTDYSPIK
ncbi:MAG TPA: NIPSNAP family protein [Humisphaera sp.]|jgi:hypothetical protein|nr:NIPSNAP family protein [Humisphaera sp.]